MLKTGIPFKYQLAQFMRWWLAELAFMIPVKLQGLLNQTPEYRVLLMREGGLVLNHLSSSTVTELGAFTLDDVAPGNDAYAEQLGELPLALALDQGMALKRRVRLPDVLEENLYQAIGYELDRLTPFRPDQVYYGVRIAERLTTSRQILVDLVLTPKTRLDTLLDDLNKQGWRPETVYLIDDGRPGDYNLLPEQYRQQSAIGPRIANASLTTLVGLLLLGMAFMPLLFAQADVSRLEDQVSKSAKQAKEVENLRQENETLMQQASFLKDKKHKEPAMIDMLEELSRIIPDTTWLDGLQYREHRVIMQGHSPSASSLIEQLEESTYFSKANFLSPVTKDVSNGLERFQIACDVANGRFSEKPQ